MADLLRGEHHDRRSVARLLGIREAAAYRQLTAVANNIPGMVWDTDATPRQLYFDRTRLTTPPDFPAAVAACFGMSLAPLFDGAFQESGMRRAFEYVMAESHRRDVFKDIDRKFVFICRGGEIALPQHSDELDQLIDDVLHSRTVSMTYRHFDGGTETLTVKPLSLCIYDHQLYLIADRDGACHPFRFSRIESIAEVGGEPFTYPSKAAYDAERLFSDSFGVFLDRTLPIQEVAVKLAPRWATHAQTHRWHKSQQIEPLASGEVVVRLRVRVCPEVRAWILGFGPDAKVLSPDALRDDVARLHAAAAR